MINAARARAVIHGRDYVTPEDLFELAEDVVLHRIRVSYEASAAGHTGAQVLESSWRISADPHVVPMRRKVKLSQDPVDARQFEVTVKHLANSLNFGQEESVFHGGGLEYAQSRLYVPGDPVKFIDWKVSARVGKLYIKEFQEPKQIPLYLLLDTSASMCLSSQPLSKYAWAVRIATGIALAAQSNMTPVGLLGCGARELHVRPTLSRNLVMEWSHKLRHARFPRGDLAGQARARSRALAQAPHHGHRAQ